MRKEKVFTSQVKTCNKESKGTPDEACEKKTNSSRKIKVIQEHNKVKSKTFWSDTIERTIQKWYQRLQKKHVSVQVKMNIEENKEVCDGFGDY